MDNRTKKIFNIIQIKEMLEQGFTEDFLEYLSKAPISVQQIISEWSQIKGIDQEREKIEEAIDQTAGVGVESNDSATGYNVKDSADYEKEQLVREYQEKEFAQRIDVTGFYFHISEEQNCPVHNTEMERIQVVVPTKPMGKYGLMTNCCSLCKRLYIRNADYKNKQEIWKSKEILYYAEGDYIDETK